MEAFCDGTLSRSWMVGRRVAAVHSRGDRRGNIRHLNICHESYKSLQNFNWKKKKKAKKNNKKEKKINHKPPTKKRRTSHHCYPQSLCSKGTAADLYTFGAHFGSTGRWFSCMTPIALNWSCTAKWQRVENVNSLMLWLSLIFIFELTQLINIFLRYVPLQSVTYEIT